MFDNLMKNKLIPQLFYMENEKLWVEIDSELHVKWKH